MEDLRLLVARASADARNNFAEIAQFVADANEILGDEVFVGNEAVGALWFFIYRDDVRDQYKIDKLGILTRTRDGNHTSSEDHRFGEFSCTPDEFASAMRNKIAQCVREMEQATAGIAALAARLSPIIQVEQNTMELGRGEAYVAWFNKPRVYGFGSNPDQAISNLLGNLYRNHNMHGRSERYTILWVYQ